MCVGLYRHDDYQRSNLLCEECPYYTTEVQNANRPEVRLHKMDAKLVDDQSGVHFVDWLKSSQQLLYYMMQSNYMKVSPAKLGNSEAANVLWLVCASWHNSVGTIME